MGDWPRLLLLGMAAWATPFALGFALFPVVDPASTLFDTLMSVAMAFSASLFGYLHLRRTAKPTLDQGLLVGTIWMVMAIALDLPFFVFGPEEMRMPVADYMADIGFTYAMIPFITAGLGRALARA